MGAVSISKTQVDDKRHGMFDGISYGKIDRLHQFERVWKSLWIGRAEFDGKK